MTLPTSAEAFGTRQLPRVQGGKAQKFGSGSWWIRCIEDRSRMISLSLSLFLSRDLVDALAPFNPGQQRGPDIDLSTASQFPRSLCTLGPPATLPSPGAAVAAPRPSSSRVKRIKSNPMLQRLFEGSPRPTSSPPYPTHPPKRLVLVPCVQNGLTILSPASTPHKLIRAAAKTEDC